MNLHWIMYKSTEDHKFSSKSSCSGQYTHVKICNLFYQDVLTWHTTTFFFSLSTNFKGAVFYNNSFTLQHLWKQLVSISYCSCILILKDREYFSKMYSICFSGPKCSGDFIPVLDLMRLNRFVLTNNFKVERLQSILGIIRQEEILNSLASLSQFSEIYNLGPLFL